MRPGSSNQVRVMRAARARFRRRSAWAVLLLAGLLLRAIVPMGYMPTIDRSSGMIEIAMCSSSASHAVQILKLPGQPADQQTSPDDNCPFAMTSAPILPQAGELEAAAAVYATELARPFVHTPCRYACWLRSAPPTGPPFLA